ncbi:membrane protein insertion efficiency factor YidD [bacterium]|nr:membrane protein insertion efficiency factor YidD [bacterium]
MPVKITQIIKWPFLGLIKIYQMSIGRVIPNSCRFYPSCSQYAYEAIESHGIFKGAWLSLRRLSRCHPFNIGGFDPVPPVRGK